MKIDIYEKKTVRRVPSIPEKMFFLNYNDNN